MGRGVNTPCPQAHPLPLSSSLSCWFSSSSSLSCCCRASSCGQWCSGSASVRGILGKMRWEAGCRGCGLSSQPTQAKYGGLNEPQQPDWQVHCPSVSLFANKGIEDHRRGRPGAKSRHSQLRGFIETTALLPLLFFLFLLLFLLLLIRV